jgi:hypothetical protein
VENVSAGQFRSRLEARASRLTRRTAAPKIRVVAADLGAKLGLCWVQGARERSSLRPLEENTQARAAPAQSMVDNHILGSSMYPSLYQGTSNSPQRREKVPGSGYITETDPKPVQQASRKVVGAISPFGQVCREDQLLYPFNRKSFRSGSAFDVFGSKPGAEVRLNEPSLVENLLAIKGIDVGHEYSRKKVTEVKSNSHVSTGGNITVGGSVFLPGTFMWPEWDHSLDAGGFEAAMFHPNSAVSDAELIAQGTRCLAVANPLKPSVTLATSLTELVFEGLPSIIGKAILTPSPKKADLIRNAAGEHLNVMFGIVPVVSDIVGVVKILRQSNKIVEQWLKNDGRKIRRRRTWDASTPAVRYDRSYSGPFVLMNALVPDYFSDEKKVAFYTASSFDIVGGSLESSVQTNIQYSFASSFEYHLSKLLPDYPDWLKEMLYGSSSDEQIARAMLEFHQFGLDPKTVISLDTVWNTLPFSWLLDWFVNLGDLVSNFTAFQQHGLQLDYGYMSCFVERRFTALYQVTSYGSVINGLSSLTSQYHRRIRATPFGFGSTFDGLSPTQTSILAALATSFSG